MKTNTNLVAAGKSARINWLLTEVLAWILVIGLFTSMLTYIYVWPWVVLTTSQLVALWVIGGLITLIPFIQKYFQVIRIRFEQDLTIRFIFIAPAFISSLLLINYVLPVSTYQETHPITGTYEIIMQQKKSEASYVGIILENNAYEEVEKIRTVHPRIVPDNPKQITYTFSRGIVGIKTLEAFYIE